MQLQVPPKEALTVLRNLVKEGDELYEWMDKDYHGIDYAIQYGEQKSMEEFQKKKAKEEAKMKEEDLKKRKEEERKKQEMEEAVKKGHLTVKLKEEEYTPSLLESISSAFGLVKRHKKEFDEAIQVGTKAMQALQKSSSLQDFLLTNSPKEEDGSWSLEKKDSIYEMCLDEYKQKRNDWVQKVREALEKISGDYIYFRQFEAATGKWVGTGRPYLSFMNERRVDDKFDDYATIHSEISEKSGFLQNLYLGVEKKVEDPLFYIPATNKLCHFNRVIELQSSSNQSALCEFMFQFSIGEKKEMAEILAFMEGLDISELTKFERQKVVNAMNDVNNKTKKMFGFPIFHKDNQTVYICPN